MGCCLSRPKSPQSDANVQTEPAAATNDIELPVRTTPSPALGHCATPTTQYPPISTQPPGPSDPDGPESLRDLIAEERVNLRDTRATKKGDYADIFEGTLDGNVHVAVKCLRPVEIDGAPPGGPEVRDRLKKRMRREVHAWMAASGHPHILHCYGYGTVGGVPAMVSAWCAKGNAAEYIENHPGVPTKQKLIVQVATALDYLHTLLHPIVHLDVRQVDVFIDDSDNAKLGDFGVARIIDEFRTGTTTSGRASVTTKYAANEVLGGQYTEVKSDVYSFGMFMLEVMSGNLIWEKISNDATLVRMKAEGAVPVPNEHPKLPENDPLWNLMSECWARETVQRPTMRQVLTELQAIGYHDGYTAVTSRVSPS